MTTPKPSAAVAAIDRMRQDEGLSIRQAARRAGISDGRWRQLAKGYSAAGGGMKIPANPTAETLAAMARAVGMPPEQLREFGEPEAARVLVGRAVRERDWEVDLSEVPAEDLLAELSARLGVGDRGDSESATTLRLVARRGDARDRSLFEGGEDDF